MPDSQGCRVVELSRLSETTGGGEPQQPATDNTTTGSRSLVTVTAYTAGSDARVAQGALDSAGIDSYVDDAQERKVRVRVDHVDALRAGDVLTDRCETLREVDEADEAEAPGCCPACGSTSIGSSARARSFGLVVALAIALGAASGLAHAAFFAVAAAAVFLLITGRQRCTMCGETWD